MTTQQTTTETKAVTPPPAAAVNNTAIFKEDNPPVVAPVVETKVETKVDEVDPKQKTETKVETKTEEKTADSKADDIVYDLKAPENSPLKADDVARIAADARELGLTSEQAQKLLERESAAEVKRNERSQLAFEEVKQGWKDASMKDPEIGGDKLAENAERAHRLAEKYASPKLKKDLSELGWGNNPEVIRMFSKIEQDLMANDTLVNGSPSGTRSGPKNDEDVFYPKK